MSDTASIKPPKFKIQQVALFPYDAKRAKKLLCDLGLDQWTLDTVKANGQVFGRDAENTAELHFNYQAGNGADEAAGKPLELEILDYTEGDNWMEENSSSLDSVSHLGMHCTAAELEQFRSYFAAEGIAVAQEVITQSHTNPVIDGQRRYNYVIFDTRDIIGVDLKFIVRLTQDGTPYEA